MLNDLFLYPDDDQADFQGTGDDLGGEEEVEEEKKEEEISEEEEEIE
ncbi:MAG: hypothetical protein LiPW39_101 [Parcubacteria group bacterium LiPW_39]|nr:MAG: hypothetical protein LiPW39_101 [Parcubacteria group bacterium LiPW_39]